MTQTRILFICHGNICRSAAAQAVLEQMARRRGIGSLRVSSAAATGEEIGNGIYPPMRRSLLAAGYECPHHAARQTVRGDYEKWDHIIGMDRENLSDMLRIYGGDPEGKLSLMMDWAGRPGEEIDDPWYTRDFDGALRQIERGCEGICERLRSPERA